MGTGKKEATRRKKQDKDGNGMDNVKTKGENFYRSAKQAKTLQMFKDGKTQRNADGRVVKAASFQSREKPKARIEPNRRWFGNTRVISQDALNSFREAIAERAADPYQVLLRSNKLPMSLVRDGEGKNGLTQHQAKMQVQSAPFNETFGPKSLRKRVKLSVGTMEDFAQESSKQHDSYSERQQQTLASGDHGVSQEPTGEAKAEEPVQSTALEPVFLKGQSKRIWNELYKVIDSSDVVLHVLDARDPPGTRCRSVEKYIKEEAPHKHLVFVLNKCDLVPTAVAVSLSPPLTSLLQAVATIVLQSSVKTSFSMSVHQSVKVRSVTTLANQSMSTVLQIDLCYGVSSGTWSVMFESKSPLHLLQADGGFLSTISHKYYSSQACRNIIDCNAKAYVRSGYLGQTTLKGVSDTCIPCLHNQFFRQRLLDRASTPIFIFAL